MKGVTAIIFDCDGVLFESQQANLAYYNRILSAFSYPTVTPQHKASAHLCHTASTPRVLAGLMRTEDLSSALAYAAQLDYREFIPLMKPEPGLRDILEIISGHYPLAVATNRGSSASSVLQHFDIHQFFSVVVTSRDVVAPKPAPDMLLLAAQSLGRKPEDCLFIGDSELDQSAAEAGAFPFVGYGRYLTQGTVLNHHFQLLDYLGLPYPGGSF